MGSAPLDRLIAAARAALGIDHLMLTVHDASFPGRESDDIGRGSPYSRGAEDLLRFATGLGFDNLQLGPQGKTSFHDPSPYNGAQFARSHQSLDLARLLEDPVTAGLLEPDVLERAVQGRPQQALRRADHEYSWRASEAAANTAYLRFAQDPARFPQLSAELQAFAQAHAGWLVPDGLYEALSELHGSDHFSHFARSPGGELDARLYHPAAGEELAAQERRRALIATHAASLNRNAFTQLLLHHQHHALRRRARELGVRLWADFQIGYAARDLWRWQSAFMHDYRLGAPPSRTNPQGQPWGYPVLDPAQFAAHLAPGSAPIAAQLLRRRISRLLDDFDGLRIDHPHGLVCPWVYRSDDPDPGHAVRHGARLRSSPASAEHPALARFALARPQDLAPAVRGALPYGDDWVSQLDEAQVSAYAELFEIVIDEMARHERDCGDLAAEVLSTCPYPLARVLERHGLGRFRVVQKADPTRLDDPYRSERARPADWIMLGTHDTAPVWSVASQWQHSAAPAGWGHYLARRLVPQEAARDAFARRLQADPRALVHALFADLFVGPARHVCVFFPDLLGMPDVYNSPGTVGDHNWRLRVPPDFAARYERDRQAGGALDIAAALGLALQARGAGGQGDLGDLARALLARAAEPARLMP